jgi:hypothetical protein
MGVARILDAKIEMNDFLRGTKMKRGYYRVPMNAPANRIDGPLADVVRAKFTEGWPKARIAREFRLNRRTVIRICASLDGMHTKEGEKR